MASAKAPAPLRPALFAPSTTTPTLQQPDLKSTACSTCVRRKVKCDRMHPCSTCRDGQFVCEYTEHIPRKRKRKDFEELQDRLDRYEEILTQNGLLPRQEAASSAQRPELSPPSGAQDSGTTSVINGPDLVSPKGKMVSGPGPGQTRYVESQLWKDLGDDLHPGSDEEDETMHEPALVYVPKTHPSPIDLVSTCLYGASTPSLDLTEIYPTPTAAMQLWRFYLRSVDPIVKLVHGPSTTALIESVSANMDVASNEVKCLLFSIYHLALSAMTEIERQELVGEHWPSVLQQYHNATRQSLILCSFHQTTSLTILQAYLLLLISVRFKYNPHSFWILSGIAVRLAQRMGLHSEDELGFSPFDVQIRRRVWWAVLAMDNFAAQHAGTTAATVPAESWETPLPMNVDDGDIWPGMTEQPQEKHAVTDMIVLLVRMEIMSIRAKAAKSWSRQSPEELEVSLKRLEDTIESKYLRYCDITNPAHYLIMVGARAAMLNARLRARLTRVKAGTATAIERKEIFTLALKLLDHDVALTSNAMVARYAWQLQVFFSWEPLICALNELCVEQEPRQVDSAWEKIDRVFAGHPNILSPKRSIEVAIGRLTLRAWHLTQRRSVESRLEPTCVSNLRSSLSLRKESLKTANSTNDTINGLKDQQALTDSSSSEAVFTDLMLNGAEAGSWDSVENEVDWKFWDDLIRNSETEAALV